MKKAILACGLFSMMMVLTSFTTAVENNSLNVAFVENGGNGGNGQQVPKSKDPLGILEMDKNGNGGNGQQVPKSKDPLSFQGGNGQQVPKQKKGDL